MRGEIASPGAVANYLLKKSWSEEIPVKPRDLQRLLYISQGWYMALCNEEDKLVPLFDEPFHAWMHGPIMEPVYHEFKNFGNNPIHPSFYMKELHVCPCKKVIIRENIIPESKKEEIEIIEWVWNCFCSPVLSSGLYDVMDTTAEGNPWQITIQNGQREGIISGKEILNRDIRQYFRSFQCPWYPTTEKAAKELTKIDHYDH